MEKCNKTKKERSQTSRDQGYSKENVNKRSAKQPAPLRPGQSKENATKNESKQLDQPNSRQLEKRKNA